MDGFEGKAVVITGGATGIGLAYAHHMGKAGARILIGEPRQNRLEEALTALQAEGIDADAMVMDVTDPESVTQFADHAWARFGHVDLLINNAGISLGVRPLSKIALEDLHRVFDVNFFGVWHCASIFGERMIAQEKPSALYNVGSENSLFCAVPHTPAYIASKHAVRGLTESMREDFPEHVTVGLICPGFVASEMTHPDVAQYAMKADEFAKIVMAQILDGAFYIVSHAYNIERIKPIHAELEAAYAKYAPRYEGDEEYDVKLLINRLS